MASHPLNEYASEWRSRAWREGQTSGRLQYTRVPLLLELMLEIRESSPCRPIRVIHRVEPHGSHWDSCLDISAGLDGALRAHAAHSAVADRDGEAHPLRHDPGGCTPGYFISPLRGEEKMTLRSRGLHPRLFHFTPAG